MKCGRSHESSLADRLCSVLRDSQCANQIDLIAGNFYLDEPLQADGTLGPGCKASIDAQMQVLRCIAHRTGGYARSPTALS